MTSVPKATLQQKDPQRSERRDALTQRLFETCLEALDLLTVYIGHHLGFYRGLHDGGPQTSAQLAARTGAHERYCREWLEQQAVTGILLVDRAGADPRERRYELEAGHAEALLDERSMSYIIPLVRYYVAAVPLLPRVMDAYRHGGGVPWSEMGREIVEAQEGFNRALFLGRLGSEDIPRVQDVHDRLLAQPAARVADVGCGAGWSAIAIAKAYPHALVEGFDVDEVAVAKARSNAIQEGVADRVRFHVRDAASLPRETYDLVLLLECLHDVPRPVEVLRAARRQLAPGGAVLVMDERVSERFTVPGTFVDRMMYGWSSVQCLPGGMAGADAAGTGAVMRPDTLRRYALEAGFADVVVLPIDNDPIRRWYRLIQDGSRTGDPYAS